MTFANRNSAPWLAASAILASAVPASAETYFTEAQALNAILGDATVARREDHTLDEALRAKLEHETNLKFPERGCSIFISGPAGQPQKYAVVMNEIGKSEPITFMVGINGQGKVTDVVIMVFRENRGWEVKEKRFLNQFRNKTIRSPIRVEEDIINYTGATLSSKAVARGVKRALALVNAFYLGPDHHAAAPAAPAAFAKSLPASPLVSVVTGKGRAALFRQARYAMGTICEVRLWCPSAQEAQAAFLAAFSEIERIEQIFSAHRQDSELSYVNREATRHSVPVSEEFFVLTRYAVRSWHETLGVSDVTVGPLINAWGLREDQPKQPAPQERTAARAAVGCDKLNLDRHARTIGFRHPGMQLDFGGLAKGYAAEKVATLLSARGVHSALVNLGESSLSASAARPCDGAPHAGVGLRRGRRRPSATRHTLFQQHVAIETNIPFGHWLVAIKSPIDPHTTPIHILLGPNENLSTSGTSERRSHLASTRTFLSHLLDPRTGAPITGLSSVTAITSSGPRSEVLAKQLLIDPDSSQALQSIRAQSPEEWLALKQDANGNLNLTARLRRAHFTERS